MESPLPDSEVEGDTILCTYPGCNRRFRTAGWMTWHRQNQHRQTVDIPLTLAVEAGPGGGAGREGAGGGGDIGDDGCLTLSHDQISEYTSRSKRRRQSLINARSRFIIDDHGAGTDDDAPMLTGDDDDVADEALEDAPRRGRGATDASIPVTILQTPGHPSPTPQPVKSLADLYAQARELLTPHHGPLSDQVLHILLYQLRLLGKASAGDALDSASGLEELESLQQLVCPEERMSEREKLLVRLWELSGECKLSQRRLDQWLHFISDLNIYQRVPSSRHLPRDYRTLASLVNQINTGSPPKPTAPPISSDRSEPINSNSFDDRLVRVTFDLRDFMDKSGPGGGNISCLVPPDEPMHVEARYVRPDIAIANLLAEPGNLIKPLHLECDGCPDDPGHTFGPVSSARWWARTLKVVRDGCTDCGPERTEAGARVHQECCRSRHVLALKFFLDGTLADQSRQKHAYKPVLFSIDNFHQSVVNKALGKGLLGYAPDIPAELLGRMQLAEGVERRVRRALYHAYLEHIIKALNEAFRDGLLLLVNGKIRRFFLAISLFVADHPEGQLICCCYDSAKATMPCRMCATLRQHLHIWDQWGPMRVMQESKDWVTDLMQKRRSRIDTNSGPTLGDINDKAKERSIHLQENATWKAPWGDNRHGPHGGTPPEPMHTYLAGVVKYAVLWILAVIRFVAWGSGADAKKAMRHLDMVVRGMLSTHSERRVPMRRFPEGVSFIIRSAKNKDQVNQCGGGMVSRDWFPCLVLILAVLLDEEKDGSGVLMPWQLLIRCIDSASRTVALFFRFKQQRIPAADVPTIRRETFAACDAVLRLHTTIFDSSELALIEGDESKGFQGIKFHLMGHMDHFIEEYGSPAGWDAETWEMAHKVFVKQLFRLVPAPLLGKDPVIVHEALLKLALNLQVRRRARRLVGMGEEEEGEEGTTAGLERRHGGRVYTVYPGDEVEVAGMGVAHTLVVSRAAGKWVAAGDSPSDPQPRAAWCEEAYPGLEIKSMVEKVKTSFAQAVLPPEEGIGGGGRECDELYRRRAKFLVGMVREMLNRDGRGSLRTRAGLAIRKPGVRGESLIIYGNLERRNQVWVDPRSAYGEEASKFGSLAEVVCCFEYSPLVRGDRSMLHLLAVRTTTVGSKEAALSSSPLVSVETAPEYREEGVLDDDRLYAYRLIPLWSVASGALCFPSFHRPEASIEDVGGGGGGAGVLARHQGRLLWVMPPHLCNSIRPSLVGSHVISDDEENSGEDDEAVELEAARLLLLQEEAVQGLVALMERGTLVHV